jgi:predicted permease
MWWRKREQDQGEGLTAHLHADVRVFAFTAGLALVAAVAFGLLPAWRAARAEPLPAIHGMPSSAPGKRPLLSGAVVAGQIALSLAMLFSAGLFARTLRNLRSVDLGFHPENVAMLHIGLSRTVYHNGGAEQFFTELLRRARALPQTRAASFASLSALSGSMSSTTIRIPGYVPPNRVLPVTNFMAISDGYWRTLGIPLIAGRDFTPRDHASGKDEGVAIVNERFARQFFSGDALGKVFQSTGRDLRVVGVVGDTKYQFLREVNQPVMYVPVSQGGGYGLNLFLQVRSAADPAQALAQLRGLVQGLDSRVPVDGLSTMEMQIDEALARERLLALLSTFVGGVSVALAAMGLYGVLSFAVKRRTREIGIRLAVGAQRAAVVRMILRQSAWMAVTGIAVGVPLALASGRLASSLLYGLQPRDPTTALGSCGLLAAAAFGAALIPAWRAARVDPMTALRCE